MTLFALRRPRSSLFHSTTKERKEFIRGYNNVVSGSYGNGLKDTGVVCK